MDYFNVTVQQDGALVSTRRGLQVSKHKYHGISFVNTTGPAQPSNGSASGSGDGGTRRQAPVSSAVAPTATPAGSFSTFSVAGPGTPGPSSTPRTPANPDTLASSQGSTRGSVRRKSRLNESGGADAHAKPMVHRWKLPKQPTTMTKNNKKDPKDPKEPKRTASTRHTSPAVSDGAFSAAASSRTSTSSFPSPLSTSPVSHFDFDSPTLSAGAGTGSHSSSGSIDGLSPPSFEWIDETAPYAEALGTGNRNGSRHGSRHGSRSPVLSSIQSAAALAASCRQVARSLPTWSTCYVPQLSRPEQRVFHQFFQLIPRKLFPFEDLLQYNPTRSSEFYWMVVQDRAAVRCVLLCGAMFRAVLGGASISEDLSAEVANVCRIVGQQLARYQEGGGGQQQQPRQLEKGVNGQDGQVQPPPPQQTVARKRRPVPTMTLECITTLALMGSSTGRYDHWHVHMQALRAMVGVDDDGAASTGADWTVHVRPALLSKMRKTDLKGAMALAILPYLPFTTRHFANASDAVLLDVTRQGLVAATTALLTAPTVPSDPASAPLVAPAVAATVADLCVFVQAVQLAADLAKTATPLPLDPFCFAEELYWIQYRLVAQPGPLRRLPSKKLTAAAAAAEATLLLPLDTTRLETDSYVRNHRAPLAAALLVPAPLAPGTTSTVLEPALRICAMLYLKEYFPDFPRNLGGYAILLHLLRCHLGAVVAEDGRFGLLQHPHARALLLWLCLVGDTVSRLANATEQRVHVAEQYDRRVFRARLVDLVRSCPGGEGTSGASLPDSDLALCQLLNIGALLHQGDGDQWDARRAVTRILEEH